MSVAGVDQGGAPRFAIIDHLFEKAVDDGTAPGLVGAVANSSGVLHIQVCGVRSLGETQPMTDDTVFWLASMSKLVTTVAVIQQVEAGDLDLDEPVYRLLPELARPEVLCADGGTRPARGEISLRHLLTHQAGMGYELMYPALLAARGPAGPPPPTSFDCLLGPLATDPGGGWTYGYGLDWAGIAVERSSGQRLDRFLADNVFGPLGMSDTGFRPLDRKRVAAVHLRGPDGVAVIPSPAGEPDDWQFFSGGAGLYGTAFDYVRLLRMILGGGSLDGARVLREETVELMWANQLGDIAAGFLGTAHPALLLPHDPLPGQRAGWSLLGLYNPEALRCSRSSGSASWYGVGGTFFWVDRQADLCGVLLAQVMPFADPALAQLQRDFERAAYLGADPHQRNAA